MNEKIYTSQHWPVEEDKELINFLKHHLPEEDDEPYIRSLKKVPWEELKLNRSPAESKSRFMSFMRKIRSLRSLTELVDEISTIVETPTVKTLYKHPDRNCLLMSTGAYYCWKRLQKHVEVDPLWFEPENQRELNRKSMKKFAKKTAQEKAALEVERRKTWSAWQEAWKVKREELLPGAADVEDKRGRRRFKSESAAAQLTPEEIAEVERKRRKADKHVIHAVERVVSDAREWARLKELKGLATQATYANAYTAATEHCSRAILGVHDKTLASPFRPPLLEPVLNSAAKSIKTSPGHKPDVKSEFNDLTTSQQKPHKSHKHGNHDSSLIVSSDNASSGKHRHKSAAAAPTTSKKDVTFSLDKHSNSLLKSSSKHRSDSVSSDTSKLSSSKYNAEVTSSPNKRKHLDSPESKPSTDLLNSVSSKHAKHLLYNSSSRALSTHDTSDVPSKKKKKIHNADGSFEALNGSVFSVDASEVSSKKKKKKDLNDAGNVEALNGSVLSGDTSESSVKKKKKKAFLDNYEAMNGTVFSGEANDATSAIKTKRLKRALETPEQTLARRTSDAERRRLTRQKELSEKNIGAAISRKRKKKKHKEATSPMVKLEFQRPVKKPLQKTFDAARFDSSDSLSSEY